MDAKQTKQGDAEQHESVTSQNDEERKLMLKIRGMASCRKSTQLILEVGGI